MKIALALLGCTAMALLVTAAPPHHHAAIPSSPHKTSAALADAMSSHGIELVDAEASIPVTGFTPVVYSPVGTK
ncbi:MAG: hypothetical protein JWR07_5442 [Nevskia sp.]|nr:hypothetical protein [Nevskia sp.]